MIPISYLNPKQINYKVSIPAHLQGSLNNINAIRTADLSKLDSELREKGTSIEDKIKEGKIWRMKFPGVIYAINHVKLESESISMDVYPVHPHRADLAFKEDRTLKKNAYPLTVCGIIEIDDSLIFGLRGGQVDNRKIGFIPGGHVDFTNYNQVKDLDKKALFLETEEELGLKPEDFNFEIFGIHDNPDTKGLNIMALLKTDISLKEIEHKRKHAKDAWEHEAIVLVKKTDIYERGLRALGCYSLTGTFERGLETYIRWCNKN